MMAFDGSVQLSWMPARLWESRHATSSRTDQSQTNLLEISHKRLRRDQKSVPDTVLTAPLLLN